MVGRVDEDVMTDGCIGRDVVWVVGRNGVDMNINGGRCELCGIGGKRLPKLRVDGGHGSRESERATMAEMGMGRGNRMADVVTDWEQEERSERAKPRLSNGT